MEKFLTKFALVVPIGTLLALILQGDLFSGSPYIIALQLTGLAVALSARITFGKNDFKTTADPGSGRLVKRGPYKFIRHPMYAGVSLFILSSIAGHLSVLNAALGIIVLLVVLTRIPIEERFLKARYPDYEQYCKETKRLVPFVY
jgi:protein-S-isoprenylcysteine O-methyltransferase Ste14